MVEGKKTTKAKAFCVSSSPKKEHRTRTLDVGFQ